MPQNYQTNAGVTDVASPDIRCFQQRPGTSTAQLSAGDTLGFLAAAEVSHFGPLQFYMARVPDSLEINTWEGAGDVWFKAAKIDAVKPAAGGNYGSGVETWPAYRE